MDFSRTGQEYVMKSKLRAIATSLAAAALLAAAAASSEAAVITYEFSGTLDGAVGDVPAGTPFSGTFSYEQTESDQFPGVAVGGWYEYIDYQLIMGTHSLSAPYTDTADFINVLNDQPSGSGPRDRVDVRPSGMFGTVPGLDAVYGMTMVLIDDSGTIFSDVSLPGAELTLTDFPGEHRIAFSGNLTGGGSTLQYGTLVSLSGTTVPIPAGVWLLGSALGLLGWTRRTSISP